MIHIEDMEEGWVFLNMRGCQPSAIGVVYSVINIMNVSG